MSEKIDKNEKKIPMWLQAWKRFVELYELNKKRNRRNKINKS